MTTTITIQMLKSMPTGARACPSARQWFAEAFPHGATLEQAWNACPEWQWQVWFAIHSTDRQTMVEFARSRATAATNYAACAAKAADYTRAARDAEAARTADYAARTAADAARAAEATRDTRAAAEAARAAAGYARKAAAHAAAGYARAVAEERDLQIAWAHEILFG